MPFPLLSAPLLAMRTHLKPLVKLQTLEHYAEATINTAFKHLLFPHDRSNKELLVSLLNNLVPAFRGNRVSCVTTQVEGMDYSSPTLLKLRKTEAFIDFQDWLEEDNQCIIQLQAHRYVMSNKNSLYYAASTYAELEIKQPVISLQILDFDSTEKRQIDDNPIDVDERRSEEMVESTYLKQFMMIDAISGHTIDLLQLIQIDLRIAKKIMPLNEMNKEKIKEWWIHILANAHNYTHDDVERMYHKEKVMPDIIYKAFDKLNVKKWILSEYLDYVKEQNDSCKGGKKKGRNKNKVKQ